MISIQSAMLIALGFFAASILALLIAPAFWKRAVSLTTRRIKERLPLTEEEIRADRDRLRAEYAISIHKLETQVDGLNLRRARDMIEINRRDASISLLEGKVQDLGAVVEENTNARRVLEQTVSDRLPKVENRLTEAKSLLFSRDREIAELNQDSRRNLLALDEAVSINAQHVSEIDRLTTSLTTRGARNRGALNDPRVEGETALLSELEALRAKSREQALLISRLQSASARSSTGRGLGARLTSDAETINGQPRLAAPSSLTLAAPNERELQLEQEIRALRAQAQDALSEQAQSRAELNALRESAQRELTGAPGVAESRITLKARLSASQAQADQQLDTIRKLRIELASANERLALQAAHFMDEMKRIGTGTMQTSAPQRRSQQQLATARRSLSQRVAQSGTTIDAINEFTASAPAASNRGGSLPELVMVPEGQANGPGAILTDQAQAGDDAPPKKARLLDRIANAGKS